MLHEPGNGSPGPVELEQLARSPATGAAPAPADVPFRIGPARGDGRGPAPRPHLRRRAPTASPSTFGPRRRAGPPRSVGFQVIRERPRLPRPRRRAVTWRYFRRAPGYIPTDSLMISLHL